MKKSILKIGIITITILLIGNFKSYCNEYYDKDFEYIVENGETIITKYKGERGELIIPSEIDGYKVKKIGENIIEKDLKERIYEIKINEGIEEIESYSFYECKEVHIVKLPDSIKKIGDYAFSGCENLHEINIPRNLEILGEKGPVFEGTKIRAIQIPEKVKRISENAFMGCENLYKIYVLSRELEYPKDLFINNDRHLRIYGYPNSTVSKLEEERLISFRPINENTPKIKEKKEIEIDCNEYRKGTEEKDLFRGGNIELICTSNDYNVAEIEYGTIRPIEIGETIIKIYSLDGNVDIEYNVKVTDKKRENVIYPYDKTDATEGIDVTEEIFGGTKTEYNYENEEINESNEKENIQDLAQKMKEKNLIDEFFKMAVIGIVLTIVILFTMFIISNKINKIKEK